MSTLTGVSLAVVFAGAALFAQNVEISDKPVRVKGAEQQSRIVKMVRPAYPPEAKAAGVEGRVRIEVHIGKDGKVAEAKRLQGPEEFVKSSLEAVRQWEWRPTMLNGNPVAVITEVDLNYTLAKKPEPQK